MDLDFSVVWKNLPTLLNAAIMTVVLTLISQFIGTIAGFFLALGRLSRMAWLRGLVWTYVWIFRGTPVLLHLFFVYYAAPMFGVTLDAFPAAIIAFSVSSAAYNTEIFRAGLQAVHIGQIEAAQAIGMRYPAIVRKILLPQAVRIIIPPYMSNFISHTKNSSLASVITVQELMLTAQAIYSSTYRAIEILSATGVIYLCLTSCLTGLQVLLEGQMKFEERGLSARRKRLLKVIDGEPVAIAASA
ncbi:amino acid ABC transporter permease [Rhizobium sp. P32RR-XVIII]|uniref:amino acid ABC transporter permease n=1 Tax=Rhizobium sp. P32RR-XVIII TaxID=2726738 RepID=UPI0014576BE7|nr:amino acid ABC transporter permease [Rhizobium sp. P32RR-XVIII]NLS07052.1 amino acid ABC transporter permease [Rhizobium sp. P32RR-XVIII]